MTTKIRARAPLRVSFAGGGTDVSPYCELHGGLVLNATISMYAYTTVERNADARVRFVAADQQASEELPLDPAAWPTANSALALHRGVYRRIMTQFNGGRPEPLTITTHSDAPAGSGLGSSSAIVVSLLSAMQEYFNLPLGEYDLARLAYDIERKDLGLAGGRQDQYAATFGGVNFIEFAGEDRVLVNPLRIRPTIMNELEASLVLFFSGVSRESAAIIHEQAQNISSGDRNALEATHALKRDTLEMKDALLRGEISAFAGILGRSWQAKKQMAKHISNSTLDALYDRACAAGALAGKVSGAGGGGFMFFVVDPVLRSQVVRTLAEAEGRVMPCHLTMQGAEAWRVN